MKELSQIYLLSLLIMGLSGCTSSHFYRQAIQGQWALLSSRVPIPEVLDDPSTPAELRHSLNTAVAVREFARHTLSLPVGDTFRDYVRLDRQYVVVNLVAVPAYSLEPHHWCYPFVGCQAYRGYFHLEDARSEQAEFEARGYDTFIGGVTAYSTLGWFDDPIHTGFTRLPEDRMAALIIHELSHKVVYIDGDTAFNESFATAVELEGLKRWLSSQGEADRFQQALSRLDHRRQTLALVQATAGRLQMLYDQADALPKKTLDARKAALFEQLRADYRSLQKHWSEPGPLGRPVPALNNANIALFRQYNQYVPGFRALLHRQHDDFPAFYDAVRKLADLPADQRHARLAQLGALTGDS
ncbi:MAG: aminopeptidase [Marinobacter sp.]|nr:aminopeptidase [Marinobacter sp.]